MESRIYLVVFMLLSLTQLTFSEDNILWCSLQQEHSMLAVNGQNVSLIFNLADPFSYTQSLVWEKGNHSVCEKLNNNRSVNCSTDESSNPGRYKLTQLNGTNFDMFIAFTEQNDSGQHIVRMQQGTQSLCTIVKLNLTIEGTSPTCSTLINRESGKLQLSCQWVQVNKGDRAQLRAANEVVYEYETPERNFRGQHSVANKLSAYVYLEDLFSEDIMPSECVVNNANYGLKGKCQFPIHTHLIREDLTQNVVFECSKEVTVISWGYTNSHVLFPVNINEERPLSDDYQSALLCGEEDGHFDITVHEIMRVQFREDQKCNISVLAKEFNSSVVTITCTNTLKNVFSEGDLVTSCNRTLNESENLIPTTYNSHGRNSMTLYLLAVLSALALIFSLLGCFTKCCRTFFRKRRYRLKEELDQETSNARNNENADSVEIAILSVQTPQLHMHSEVTQSVSRQCPSDDNNRCANRDKSSPDWDLPHRPPNLPSRRHLLKRVKKCCDTSTVKQLRGENACDTKIISKNSAGAGASNASNHGSTYCSVDDVQGTLTTVSIKDPASESFLSSFATSMTSLDYQGDYDLFNTKESSSPSADPDKRNLVIRSHSDHTANPDSFYHVYAQPDMSRKTKRMTSVESDYDDPRPPGEKYFQNIIPERNSLESSVLNNDPTYGNYNTDPPTGSPSDI